VNLLQCDFIIDIRDNRIVSLDISVTMDPFWVKVKGYLKRFEEILEGIQEQYTDNAWRIRNMENIVSLLNKTTKFI
jgi:hypothetical protein